MSEEWYYTKSGQRFGPIDDEQLRQILASSEGQSIDLVWKKGMADWKKAVDVGLVPAVPSGPPPIPQAASGLIATKDTEIRKCTQITTRDLSGIKLIVVAALIIVGVLIGHFIAWAAGFG